MPRGLLEYYKDVRNELSGLLDIGRYPDSPQYIDPMNVSALLGLDFFSQPDTPFGSQVGGDEYPADVSIGESMLPGGSQISGGQHYGAAMDQARRMYEGEEDLALPMAANFGVGLLETIPVIGGMGAVVAKGAARTATNIPYRKLLKQLREGGFTLDIKTGEQPTTGIMSGIYKNIDPRNIVLDDITQAKTAHIKESVNQNVKPLMKDEHFIGGWIGDDGKVYLEPSRRFPNKDEFSEALIQAHKTEHGVMPDKKAMSKIKTKVNAYDQIRRATKFGEKTDQISVMDLSSFEELPVGKWEEYIKGSEFEGRLDEMGLKGKEFLEQFPTPEWWDVHGTSLERVYGKENTEQLAGLIASTAPNTSPKPNVIDASEYMRRIIKGEDIVQPNFRVPVTAVNRQPGGLMPMETTSRAPNLKRVQEGRFAELSSDKVQQEYRALMGDKDAMVFDRWWSRIAENPSLGVFTSGIEGLFPKATKGLDPYKALMEVVGKKAESLGRSARDFSADVWAGVRETARENKGKVFGQQHGVPPGESKSYSDIFDDLVKDKARIKGLTVEKFEEMLRNGNAELLSMVLGTPVGLTAYYEYQKSKPDEEDVFGGI
jgi:hypothetical protein